jgi:hypothetical protein
MKHRRNDADTDQCCPTIEGPDRPLRACHREGSHVRLIRSRTVMIPGVTYDG